MQLRTSGDAMMLSSIPVHGPKPQRQCCKKQQRYLEILLIRSDDVSAARLERGLDGHERRILALGGEMLELERCLAGTLAHGAHVLGTTSVGTHHGGGGGYDTTAKVELLRTLVGGSQMSIVPTPKLASPFPPTHGSMLGARTLPYLGLLRKID